MTTLPDIVIGSGPSGVAAAHALLARGRRVLMIDAGYNLEPERAAALNAYLETPAAQRTPRPAWVEESDREASNAIPKKLLFGSEFPFAGAEEHLGLRTEGVGLKPSLAVAGLSNVWGAALAPYAPKDTQDWPVGADELAPHYRAALELTGMSAALDDLEKLLPLHAEQFGDLGLSNQAAALAKTLNRNAEALKSEGVHFGRARVAIRANPNAEQQACVKCGQCLSGCPFDQIYSANWTLNELRHRTNFEYRSDIIIQRVEETQTHTAAHGYERTSRAPISLNAERIFLACGVVPTTRILLNSTANYDCTAIIKDSQYFLVPLLLNSSVSGARKEQLHTLCQLFLEIDDPDISPHLIQAQVYSYNSLITAKLNGVMGPIAKLAPALRSIGENRLMLIQAYLHSNHSSAIEAKLHRDGRYELSARINPEAKERANKLAAKLFKLAPKLGATPILPMLELGEPGRGFHAGGSFPMSAAPSDMETDTLGRPFGWKHIHAVDATILPSIAATTITLPVMANAHRIASYADTMEAPHH